MQRDARAFLWDAHAAAEAILEFVDGKSYSDYAGDRLLRSAVERQFEIIGEALNQLCKLDRKSTRLNSSHSDRSRMPSSA